MDRTVGVAGDAVTAAVNANPDLGCLSVTWRPCRPAGRAPAAAPVLSEREAVKNRSLAAGVGTSVKVQRACSLLVDLGRPMPAEEVTIFCRERRVLVARKVLLENGEVAPAYRKAKAAASDGGSASGSAAEPAVGTPRGTFSGPSEPDKGKGSRRGGGGGGSPTWIV
ncbi:hypothetical protein MMPV_004627 [Pyropia vietnamensis]